jgi:cytochrome c-type biogenesis protein CcmH
MSTAPSRLRRTPPRFARGRKKYFLPQRSWGSTPKAGGGGCCTLLCLILLSLPALAVQPDEILKDPVLEARARNISTGLRCLVCQNQSIDDSDAPVARDLRILIREQLQQKHSDEEVIDFVVARYGEFVLLKPRLKPSTVILWATPFLLLLAGLVFAFRRRPVAVPDSLSTAEQAEVEAILRK